ncbi:MAG: 4-alpha-glucanotransferase [Coriobacteriaceae bacterium]|nr:4-alpha-glucanotransferase [Coriobacteriaceae bacterium]
MRACHVTSRSEYRSPFGAVQLGGTVVLGIDVWGEDAVGATLRVWTDERGEELLPMEGACEDDHVHYSVSYTPAQTGVVWYSFDLAASDGATWRYGAREGWTTGEGDFAYGNPPSFQLTVYVPRQTQPDWYKNGIVYQVFPDRFARGADWRERAEKALAAHREGPARVLVEDWDTPPAYKKSEDGDILEWDFYGGTLRGVREKLDYLADLGVTVIYLNPIFEAASNHRYDTADYLRIDPMLGDEEEFCALAREAAERGISIMLDGVFNHCGQDSRYFNRYGNYPEPGAWQGGESPYRDWFFFNEDGTYDGWWGNPDLPDVNEKSPEYRELICGQDGVVRKWLRAGARGWRLDVADELSDSFIEDIKAAMVAERPDGALVGEVWEDASNKMAYGKLRQYFEGTELDGTMNYPLRTALLAFVRNQIGAPEMAARLEQLRENYPRDAFFSCLNLLGSHDRERLFTMLGDAPDPDTLSDEECAAFRLDEGHASLAMSRLWLTVLLQMTLPGVPCVYYGDERGMEGFRDPYNRAAFPWDGGRMDCATVFRNAIAVRKALPVLTTGDFEPFADGEDVFGFWRRGEDGECVCVLANASLHDAHTVRVPMVGEAVSDVVSGTVPAVVDGRAEAFLWPLGTAVLHFHEERRLQEPLEPGMGVLCHVTSLPNEGRPGTLGAPARRFVDWLAECGQTYWQVLPVNPADGYGSPYAGLAAFAGNTCLLEKDPADVLAELKDADDDPDYRAFLEKNKYWLTPYATFRAIKDLLGEGPWQEWPDAYARFSPGLARRVELADGVDRHRKLQYEFQREWDDLKAYANGRGVKIVGDMPMYVSGDSADVWAERDIFELDEKGYAQVQAGCPGDGFDPEGQLWGNPTYRWDVLAARGYDWWLARLERAVKTYDYVRLDHFIGFSSYYKIAKGKPAREGSFSFGPGLDLFRAAYQKLGPLPFIAEDLGVITPAVRALIAETGIPGMDIVQFSDGDVREGYEPKPGTVTFTGTHDNQTLLGFCQSRFGLEGDEAAQMADRIAASVLGSKNDVAIMPLQDVLGLDDAARMNVPGVAEGNWSWQAAWEDVVAATGRLTQMAQASGRFREASA